MQHGRETTVLLVSCRWPPRQLPIPLGTELDWAWLLRTARQHHVLALVAETLLALSPRQLTPAVREHLAGYRAAVGLRNTYLARELVGLLEQLERGGIVALPFKGPVLALGLYGDLARREFSDLDLLIHPHDVQAAKQLLVDRGYQLEPPLDPEPAAYVARLSGARERAYLQSRSEHHFVRTSDSLTVDLHLALADPYIRFGLPFKDLLDRSHWLLVHDSRVRTFSAEDTLLMLCLNGAKDDWRRLQRTCDVAALLSTQPTLDQQAVLARARGLGAVRMLHTSLLLAHALLGTELPRALAQDVEQDAAAQRLAEQVHRRLFAAPGQPPALSLAYARAYVRTRERLRDRLWFYVQLALTPSVSDWRSIRLPEPLRWMYYVVRPLRLAWQSVPSSVRSRSASASKSRPVSKR